MAILLGDDGTMDTVVYCSECGREYRGNCDGGDGDDEQSYDDFVDWLIEEIEGEHVCGEDDI